MTIDVGYAHLVLPDGTVIDFVDVPGHERLVGNMLVGAGEIDAAMIVVAADDGPRAQTLEHLELLDALRIRHGIGVVTKADAVDPARVAEVIAAVERLVARTSLAGIAVVAASASTGDGIERLRDVIGHVARSVSRPATGAARLPIDRVFTVRGRGTVITGTLRGGTIERGATLRLEPDGRIVRVREVQVHGETVERAEGGRAALNIAGTDATAIRRGMTLTAGGNVEVTDRVLVALWPAAGLTDGAPRLPADRARVRLHLDTAEVGAVVGRSGRHAAVLDDGSVAALLRLEQPLAVAPGDRFVLRRPSPARAEGGGRILDPRPPAGVSRRRVTPDRVRAVAEARTDTERHAAIVELHGAVANPAGHGVVLADDVAAALRSLALALVANGPLPLAELRASLAADLHRRATVTDDDAGMAAMAAIDRGVTSGDIARDGDRVRDVRDEPRGPSPALTAAMDRLESILDVPAPPSLAEAARAAGCPPEGVRALEATGRIIRVDLDLAWAARTYRALESTALELAARGPLAPATLRDATGTSRKYVMALLEDLGRRAVLARTPAGHVPGPRAPTAAR